MSSQSTSSSTVILGVDPGIRTTGYGIMEGGRLKAAGKITTKASVPEGARYATIFNELCAVIREHDVTEMAIERFVAIFTSQVDPVASPLGKKGGKRRSQYDGPANPDSLFKMKGAQTAAQLAALAMGVTVYEYTLQEWKGDARRSKDEIRKQVALLFGVEIKNDNITDGIMIANHHARTGRLNPRRGVRAEVDPSVFSETAEL